MDRKWVLGAVGVGLVVGVGAGVRLVRLLGDLAVALDWDEDLD